MADKNNTDVISLKYIFFKNNSVTFGLFVYEKKWMY